MSDYLWPDEAFIHPPPFVKDQDPSRRVDLYRKIEGFFEDRLGAPARLLPSGRAALSLILKFVGANRSHVVFSPKWSSSCVWECIGLRANPTVSFSPEPDIILAVHKWGFRSDFLETHSGLLIEDSVDSLFADGNELFSLGSDFDIVSLPKVIGSYSGAIVFSRNSSFLQFSREKQQENAELAIRQSRIKHRRYFGNPEPFDSIHPFELENTRLEINDLLHIESCLQNYAKNIETVQRRLEKLCHRFPELSFPEGRYPIHFPAPEGDYQVEPGNAFISRWFDVKQRLDSPEFRPCHLLPLHMGVDEHFFDRLLAALSK